MKSSSKAAFKKVKTIKKNKTVTYVKGSLKSGKKYWFKVRAYKLNRNKKVYGKFSAVKTATTQPTKVKSVKATAAGASDIKISWEKNNSASGYEVHMASSADGKYTKTKTITKSSTLSYTNGNLKSNTKYWFKVRAYRLHGKQKVYGKFSEAAAATTKQSDSSVTPPGEEEETSSESEDGDKQGFSGEIQIVHVNDMHTYLDDSGNSMGYANTAAFYEYAKAQNENTLFLDAGDCYFGTANGTVGKGEPMAEIVNTMGIDVQVTGNHEYTYGLDQLLKIRDMVNHPIICANIVRKDTGEQPFASYEIITMDNGMKVGVIGLTTVTSASMGADNIRYVDAIARAKEVLAEVKPQVDMTIALCHIGDKETLKTTDIANEIDGFDLIVDGHSHTTLPQGRRDNATNTLIVQTGEYTEHVGLVTVQVEGNKPVDASAVLYSADQVENELNLAPKAETQALVDSFNQTSAAFFSERVGATTVQLDGTSADIRHHETNLGNLFADVMRTAAGAEIGMFKAGPIATKSVPVGEISRETLAGMTRVDSLIITKEVAGRDIIDFLNYSLSTWPALNGAFQQVSGVSFSIDENANGARDKVFNVKVGGVPIDLDATYTVATILGSDEEEGMINGTLLDSHGFSNSIMYDYIRSLPNETITANEAYTEGRITIESR